MRFARLVFNLFAVGFFFLFLLCCCVTEMFHICVAGHINYPNMCTSSIVHKHMITIFQVSLCRNITHTANRRTPKC